MKKQLILTGWGRSDYAAAAAVALRAIGDADDRECDPCNIPDGFIATTIAIHLGRRIG